MAKRNAVIGQSGGPTSVINQSLVGAIQEVQKSKHIDQLLGARHGVRGIINDDFIPLSGIPADSRASRNGSLSTTMLSDDTLAKVRGLNAIARQRGQTLAQMALAWTLRDGRITSALIGASSVDQLEENLRSLEQLSFAAEELAAIDRFATDSSINIWTERAHAE